ncbi:hypothetical protein GW916_14935 [bacterium]|nr:hypothetical protein [bacterium]
MKNFFKTPTSLIAKSSRELVVGLFFLGLMSFGNLSHANLNASEVAETNIEHAAFLNHYYPGLDLSFSSDPESQDSISRQIEILESVLRGEYSVPKGKLTEIACKAPGCGNGDGSCHTC